ncbi:MAG: NUDIX domain-containing protein [Peptoniphilus sp.]|nr:NUDIX domain-containing protein [Peptoniphilus sp.]MDY6044394.1 NUDIX domain-containing protein [Peptoniphilus sp.]
MHWIEDYEPKTTREEEDKDHLLRLNERLIAVDRKAPYHYTTSSLVIDPEKNSLLMIYHKIYRSWSWPGGHVEVGENLFYSALRELYEETKIRNVRPLSESPIGMELMPVSAHERKGEFVDSHFHINFCFGFWGDDRDTLLDPDENRMWVPLEELDAFVTEEHMLPVYRELIRRMRDWPEK